MQKLLEQHPAAIYILQPAWHIRNRNEEEAYVYRCTRTCTCALATRRASSTLSPSRAPRACFLSWRPGKPVPRARASSSTRTCIPDTSSCSISPGARAHSAAQRETYGIPGRVERKMLFQVFDVKLSAVVQRMSCGELNFYGGQGVYECIHGWRSTCLY